MHHVSEFRVRYSETDQMGVVYHANYLVWCEIGRTDLMRATGNSYAKLEQGGIALAVVDASLRFKRPARYDNRIRVTTRVKEVRTRAVRFEYQIDDLDQGVALAEGSTTLVAMNSESKGCAIPAAFRSALESYVSE